LGELQNIRSKRGEGLDEEESYGAGANEKSLENGHTCFQGETSQKLKLKGGAEGVGKRANGFGGCWVKRMSEVNERGQTDHM